jgi:methionyl-tRNA synthetase
METVLWTTAEVLRVIGLVTQPFIPIAAGKLLDLLAVRADRRMFAHAVPGHALVPGTDLPAPMALFPRYVEPETAGEGA